MNKEEIFELCNRFAKKEKVQFIYSDSERSAIDINKFTLDKTNVKENRTLSIKVIVNGQTASVSLTKINKQEIEKAIIRAKKIAKLKNNIKINDFGSDKSNRKIKYDPKLKKLDLEELIPELKDNIHKEKYVKGYMGGMYKSGTEGFYINPYTSYDFEKYSLEAMGIVNTKNKKDSSGHFWQTFTKKEDINITDVFNQARKNAYNLIDPVQGKKGVYDLIFVPDRTYSLIDNFILDATNADLIHKNRSYLSNLYKKKIFSNNLNIIEDPKIDYFTGSRAIDHEGFKTSKKKIVENGIFKKIIYNQEDAVKYNKKPTGNGIHGSTEHTNIFLEPGKQSIDNIIKNTKKGLLVYTLLGMHSSNITNGEFSTNISNAVEIENGKLKNAVTNLSFSGNMKEIFKNANFSKEQKFFGNGLIPFSKFSKVKLI